MLSKTALFSYKVDNPYITENEAIIIFDDPQININ